MSELPTIYSWLGKEPGPKMLMEALKLYGVLEKQGNGNNPAILAWAKECGIKGYTADSIPWCGLFMAVVAQRAGKPLPGNPLWAKDWASWGDPVKSARLGDVLVFARDGGGHVGLYAGEDDAAYHVLGGNQGDAVSIKRVLKSRCIAIRNHYSTAVPDNVRSIRLAANGRLSTGEA